MAKVFDRLIVASLVSLLILLPLLLVGATLLELDVSAWAVTKISVGAGIVFALFGK